MSIEAMRLALEYLESEVPFYECEGNYPPTGMTESIEALRAAIEAAEKQSVCARCGGIVYDPVILQQAEKQEPVAWMHDSHVGFNVPLYTAPPQREWQGLTDEEIEDCMEMSIQRTCRAIEAKLKEKNT